jgi:hypothetical protein
MAIAALAASLPHDSMYVTVRNGHLYHKGERVRFWGSTGTFRGESYAQNRAVVRRMKELGFTMVRSWFTPGGSYTKGDGSRDDLRDHFLWLCSKNGIKVWYAGLNALGDITPGDVDIIDEPETAPAWKEGVSQLSQKRIRNNLARYWDERIHRLGIARMKRILNHTNKYTGYRYADDPVFAVWELSNEEWWFHEMRGGNFLAYPSFFTRSLQRQWNAYLTKKYGTHEALSRAWHGNFVAGEHLEKATVLLAPFLGDITDEQAASLGVNVAATGMQGRHSKEDFNERRGADVVRFLLKIWLSHKKAQEEAIEEVGKSVRLCPTVWDNGVGWGLQTQFMQQHADAVSHDSYFNGAFTPDSTHKRFPWMSMLEELPRLSWIDPWLEQNKVPDKPFFVYETQIMKPAKYRAEYPMHIARTAAIQDWDIVIWHYWGFPPDTTMDEPYGKPLNYPNPHHFTQGYHFQYDEVQQSAMTAAGEIFKNRHLHTVDTPTLFTFGAPSLYGWDMHEYGEIGDMFVPTTYRHGMRMYIDSTLQEKVVIEGPRIRGRGIFEPCPLRPTNQISHDWQQGTMVFDAPGTAMFCGFLANAGNRVQFDNGVVLRDVTFANPDDTPYPVTGEEGYCSFTVTSSTRAPLAETDTAIVSLVSTSFNSGFSIDHDTLAANLGKRFSEWSLDLDAVPSRGGMPVLVTRVGAAVELPMCEGMRYTALDWHCRELFTGTLQPDDDKKCVLQIPDDEPVFLIRLTRR